MRPMSPLVDRGQSASVVRSVARFAVVVAVSVTVAACAHGPNHCDCPESSVTMMV